MAIFCSFNLVTSPLLNEYSQVLDLSANSIERMPTLASAMAALAELILDENALRTLGNELLGLPKLKKVSARSNRITAKDPATGQQVCAFIYRERLDTSCAVLAQESAKDSKPSLTSHLLGTHGL